MQIPFLVVFFLHFLYFPMIIFVIQIKNINFAVNVSFNVKTNTYK